MTTAVSIIDNLGQIGESFKKQNSYDMDFTNECLFARQQIVKNDFTLKTASNAPGSLKSAILNVAAIGISLNPASAHAYLVPRDGAICLDISYRGLVKLATDSGSIDWAKAVLVYEGDEFKWRGPAEQPLHEADVFDNARVDATDPLKNLKGGYCLAKLTGGGYMVDVMTAAEIIKVKETSKAKNGPWKNWGEEMAKKTLVKRASKSWPQSGGRDRVDKAIEVVNQHEGLVPDAPRGLSDTLLPSPEQTAKYLELAEGEPIEFWIWYSGLDQRIQASLPNIDFPKGKKGAMMSVYNAAIESGRQDFQTSVDMLTEMADREDEAGALEILIERSQDVRDSLIDACPPEHKLFLLNVPVGVES